MSSEDSLEFEALFARDGVTVSRSPWGEADEIGRLNWVEEAATYQTVSRASGSRVFDLSVEYFIGMPTWTGSGDPKYEHWMTHTPQGSVNDGLTGFSAEVHEKYSLCADSFLMNTHCGTHIDTLTHVGHYGHFWNGWTPERDLGGRHWLRGGSSNFPPIIARGILLDIAGLHGVECLPDAYAVTPEDLRAAARRQKVEPSRGDVVLVRTGMMSKWPGTDYLESPPGVGLGAARYLCEEVGVMCAGTDTIAFEPLPSEDSDSFLPVHGYMLATAGAPIVEVLQLDALAEERVYAFLFLGFPMRIRGSTGAPLRPVALPLDD